LIRVEDLWAGYRRDRPVLRGISFEVQGGFLVLLGPNGAGKTTLLSVLSGFMRRMRGECIVLGRDCSSLLDGFSDLVVSFEKPPHIRQKVGDVYATICGYRECFEDRFLELLERFNLDSRLVLKKDFHKLSAGERMKTYLSMLLSLRAKLYLLDEPNSNLDPRSRSVLRKILLEMSREASFLVTTHVYEYVEDLATHIAIIKDGRLLVFDTLERAISKYVRDSCLVKVNVRQEEGFIEGLERMGASYKPISPGSILVAGCRDRLSEIAGLPGVKSVELATLESLYRSIVGGEE